MQALLYRARRATHSGYTGGRNELRWSEGRDPPAATAKVIVRVRSRTSIFIYTCICVYIYFYERATHHWQAVEDRQRQYCKATGESGVATMRLFGFSG